MKKSTYLTLLLLILGVFLHIILIGTSPRILCSEVREQLLKSIDVLIYQFAFLFSFIILICKLIFKDINRIIKKLYDFYIIIHFSIFLLVL